MIKILITGGSGFIGTHLTTMLTQKGYHVEHLARSRHSRSGVKTWLWDLRNNFIEEGAFERGRYTGFHLVHLAGEGIMDKAWTDQRKAALINSRVDTISFLYRQFKQRGWMPDSVVSAAGSAIYGLITSEKILTETDAPGTGFIADCCIQWEEAARLFAPHCPVASLRTPLVVDKNEGGFPKMAAPLKFGLKPIVGSGKQWVPWVHVHDLCKAYVFAIEKKLDGPYNVAAPTHHTYRNVVDEISRTLYRSFITVKVPMWTLKLLYGERRKLVTEGSRIDSRSLQQQGFQFDFPVLEQALTDIYR